ncbi:MAG: hypothetical protein AAGK97_04725 [Bacteroidota bacterium]
MKLILKCIALSFILFVSTDILAQKNYNFQGSVPNSQRMLLNGNGNNLFLLRSNNNTQTLLEFQDVQGTRYGRIGGYNDGSHFGLIDGDGNWSLLNVKDQYSQIRINNVPRMTLFNNGNIGMNTTQQQAKLQVGLGGPSFATLMLGDQNGSGSTMIFDVAAGLGHSNMTTGTYLKSGSYTYKYGGARGVARLSMGDQQFSFFVNSNAPATGRNVIWEQKMFIGKDGVGVNTSEIPDGFVMSVDGNILAEEVHVQLSDYWPDYVFQDDYNLMPLVDLESFIELNKHLPNIPSAIEMEENGQINLNQINLKLLEKVEELTLYIIQLNKLNHQLNERVANLENGKH